jgi:MerR family transcriptional regulator/heat shock protein HspR
MVRRTQQTGRRLDQRSIPFGGAIPPALPIGNLPARVSESEVAEPDYDVGSRQNNDVPELRGLYIISVAARLLEMHPQTLRKYERVGLVRPSRTLGMLRLYSQEDIARLRVIKHLVDHVGMNLAGVQFVMGMLIKLQEAKARQSAAREQRRLIELLGLELERLLDMMDTAFAGPLRG